MSKDMKKQTILYVVIGVLIISIMFLGGFVLKQQSRLADLKKEIELNEKEKNKDNEEQTGSNKEPDAQVESEILSDNIKRQLDKNIEYLNYLGKEQLIDNTNLYSGNKTASSYTEREKLGAIIFASITKNQNNYIEPIALENISEEIFKEVFPGQNVADFKNPDGTIDGTYLIDSVEISNRYKELFGEYPAGTDTSLKCPNINYYKANKKYVVGMANCGGTNAFKNLSYSYKYTSQGERYYVYMSVGMLDMADGTVYRDYAMKDLYLGNVEDFKIDNTNYKEFEKFKLTFEKRNDNYIFKSLEKLKED